MRDIIRQLPQSRRETLELFYLDDRTCAEISQSLRIPEGTVKSRLHDARRRLQKILLGYMDDSNHKDATQVKRDELPF